MNRDTFSITEFRDHLLRECLVGDGQLLGCTPDEIRQVARAQRVVKLPALYEEFLAVMGKNPYPLMWGTDWAYEDLLELKQDAVQLLRENDVDPGFLDDAVVIAMHQGYVFYYIPSASTAPADPPVWTYIEAEEPVLSFPTFRDFLLSLEGTVARRPTSVGSRRRPAGSR